MYFERFFQTKKDKNWSDCALLNIIFDLGNKNIGYLNEELETYC